MEPGQIEEIKGRYRKHATSYDTARRASDWLRPLALARLGLKSGVTVLELGCGKGLSRELLQQGVGALASRGAAPGPDAGQPALLSDDGLKELTRGVRSLPARRRRGRSGAARTVREPQPLRDDQPRQRSQGGSS